ncbi:hypothetical protein FPQ10_07665 [Allobacillus sp. SKP2-8]|uniref:hypothetical protein n=1 Tax=unclassified Allobacillus TaxID=2628859 RepID=UPI0011824301|nr:hypothetical protein [Allobacillus sp. SKP2-8]TSJ66324.1 hypothetical protein FPQ10_07665 [Allobacillus sp. SKP2-8]
MSKKQRKEHPIRKAQDLNLDGVTEAEESEDGITASDIPDEVPAYNQEIAADNSVDANQYTLDLENEGRNAYDLDIDRMINEGMAGGYIRGERNQITEAHPILENDAPFPTPGEENESE